LKFAQLEAFETSEKPRFLLNILNQHFWEGMPPTFQKYSFEATTIEPFDSKQRIGL
jgi:hypothetical protein